MTDQSHNIFARYDHVTVEAANLREECVQIAQTSVEAAIVRNSQAMLWWPPKWSIQPAKGNRTPSDLRLSALALNAICIAVLPVLCSPQ